MATAYKTAGPRVLETDTQCAQCMYELIEGDGVYMSVDGAVFCDDVCHRVYTEDEQDRDIREELQALVDAHGIGTVERVLNGMRQQTRS